MQNAAFSEGPLIEQTVWIGRVAGVCGDDDRRSVVRATIAVEPAVGGVACKPPNAAFGTVTSGPQSMTDGSGGARRTTPGFIRLLGQRLEFHDLRWSAPEVLLVLASVSA
jgi:hypothetical protein